MQDVIGSVCSNGLEDLSRSWAGFMAWMFALLSEVRGRISQCQWFPTRSCHKCSVRLYLTRPLCKTAITTFLMALGIIILQPPIRAFHLLSSLWQTTKQPPFRSVQNAVLRKAIWARGAHWGRAVLPCCKIQVYVFLKCPLRTTQYSTKHCYRSYIQHFRTS